MPSDRPDTGKRYIKIEDFTLGIHSTYWSATSERTTFKKNGAATVENTYQCVANPDGVLGPLPAVTAEQTETNLWGGVMTVTDPLAVLRITDMIVTGPVSNSPHLNIVETEVGSFVSVGFSFPVTGATVWGLVRRYNTMVQNPPLNKRDIFLFKMGSFIAGFSVPGIVLGEGRSAISTVTNPPPPATAGSAHGKIVISLAGSRLYTQIIRISGTLIANDQVLWPDYYTNTRQQYSPTASDNINDISGNLYVYPGLIGDIYVRSASRPFNQTGGVPAIGELATSFQDFVTHQGRIVGISFLVDQVSTVGQVFTLLNVPEAKWMDSNLAYNVYPDYYVQNQEPNLLLASPENTSGYGTIGSINASQLLVIKHSGGGALIQGDLDNPTVSQLPYLESTQGVCSHGINTPLGFVYGSRNGVFVWAGGEQSEKISQQIDGFFWDSWTPPNPNTSSDYTNHFGISSRFSYWHPWIVVPNNYFFDTRTSSWWRYLNPLPAVAGTRLPFAYSDIDPVTGDLFSACWAMNRGISPTASVVWDRFANDVFQSDYSWQSQPLLESELVIDEYDEIVLIAQRQNTTGVATITITVTGFNEDGSPVTPAVTVFTLAANTQIQMIRQLISVGGSGLPFTGKGITIRIEVANTAAAAASLIHDVWLGISTQFGEHPLVST